MQTDRKKVRQKDNSYPHGLQSHCCLHTANPTGRPEKECHMCPKIQNRERSSIQVKIVTWQVMRFSSGEFLSIQSNFIMFVSSFSVSSTTQTWVHHHSRYNLSETLAKRPRLKVHHAPKSLFRYNVCKIVWEVCEPNTDLWAILVPPKRVVIKQILKLLFWALAHLTVLKLH